MPGDRPGSMGEPVHGSLHGWTGYRTKRNKRPETDDVRQFPAFAVNIGALEKDVTASRKSISSAHFWNSY